MVENRISLVITALVLGHLSLSPPVCVRVMALDYVFLILSLAAHFAAVQALLHYSDVEVRILSSWVIFTFSVLFDSLVSSSVLWLLSSLTVWVTLGVKSIYPSLPSNVLQAATIVNPRAALQHVRPFIIY